MIIDQGAVAAALPAYDIGTMLGRGGHGLVLAGRHRRLERDVAVKVLTAGPEDLRTRFVAEARLLAALDHPHVVRVYDYVEADDLCLLVMERLAGGSMRARAAKGSTVASVCAVGLAVAAALECAHDAGVLHRDVKPDNMLFTSDSLLKVTDFGIAKILGEAATAGSGLIGTPVYMAPEQIEGRPLTPTCDIYALAIVLYELFSGRPPFPRSMPVMTLMHHHLTVPPAPLSTTPPALAAVVERALRKDPAARHDSARTFALDLAAAAAATLGPDWLSKSVLPVRLDDEVRDVARGAAAEHTAIDTTPADARGTDFRDVRTVGTLTFEPCTPPRSSPSRPPPVGEQPSEPVQRSRTPPPPAPTTTPRGLAAAARRLGRGRGRGAAARAEADRSRDGRDPIRVDGAYCVALAPDGTLFVSQRLSNTVVRVDLDGTVSRVAGSGKSGPRGDGGDALAAELDGPCGLAVAPDGALLVADSFNNRVRRIGLDGGMTTVVGGNSSTSTVRASSQLAPGVALPATDVALNHPHGLAVDGSGSTYVADTGGHRILRVDREGQATTVAGVGVPGTAGDGGPAEFAQLRRPHDVTCGADGTLYVADTDNRCVRAVSTDGTITTVAGVYYGGDRDDVAPARRADLGRPRALATAPKGGLLLSDPDGGQVRLLTPDGLVTTVSRAAERPVGIGYGPDGTLFVADTARQLVFRLRPDHDLA